MKLYIEPSSKPQNMKYIEKLIITSIHEITSLLSHMQKYDGVIVTAIHSKNKRILIGRYNRKHIDIDIQSFVGMRICDAQEIIEDKNNENEQLRIYLRGNKIKPEDRFDKLYRIIKLIHKI